MTTRLWRTLPLLVWGLCATGWAAVTVTFRDGVSPSPTYLGTRDVVVYSQDGLCWDATQACDTTSLIVDNAPAQSAVLMRWDLSSLPTNATVDGVSLTLYVEAGSTHDYPAYESLRAWVEGQAHWTQYAAGASWQTAGGQGAADHGSAVLTTLTGPTASTFVTLPFTTAGVAVVQQWISTPGTNHGLHVIDFASPDALIWASSETGTAARRPRLTVTYNGGTVADFQQGAQPSIAYAGATDQTYGSGPNPLTTNYNNSTELGLGGAGGRQSVLLKFDLTLIPPWATVNAAQLTVNSNNTSLTTFAAYEALQPWVETEVTWSRFDATRTWAALGAESTVDHGLTVMVTATSPSPGAQTWPLTPAGVQLVNDWVSGARVNHGFLFQDYVATGYLSFDRREHTTVGRRPGMVVTYTEGQVAFSPSTGTLEYTSDSPPVTVRRQPLAGLAVASGAPSLNVSVTSSSGTTEFAPTPAGPWASSYAVTIAAGESESAAFVFRDANTGKVTLTASANAAWDNGTSTWTVVVPGALPPDAGGNGPPGGANPLQQHLHVSSGCSSSDALFPFLLPPLWILGGCRKLRFSRGLRSFRSRQLPGRP